MERISADMDCAPCSALWPSLSKWGPSPMLELQPHDFGQNEEFPWRCVASGLSKNSDRSKWKFFRGSLDSEVTCEMCRSSGSFRVFDVSRLMADCLRQCPTSKYESASPPHKTADFQCISLDLRPSKTRDLNWKSLPHSWFNLQMTD